MKMFIKPLITDCDGISERKPVGPLFHFPLQSGTQVEGQVNQHRGGAYLTDEGVSDIRRSFTDHGKWGRAKEKYWVLRVGKGVFKVSPFSPHTPIRRP